MIVSTPRLFLSSLAVSSLWVLRLTWAPLLVLLEFAADVGNVVQKQSPVCEVDQSYASGCAPYSQSRDPVENIDKIYTFFFHLKWTYPEWKWPEKPLFKSTNLIWWKQIFILKVSILGNQNTNLNPIILELKLKASCCCCCCCVRIQLFCLWLEIYCLANKYQTPKTINIKHLLTDIRQRCWDKSLSNASKKRAALILTGDSFVFCVKTDLLVAASQIQKWRAACFLSISHQLACQIK